MQHVMLTAAIVAAAFVVGGAAATVAVQEAAPLVEWAKPAVIMDECACGGGWPVVVSVYGGYYTCDWGPGASPRYTTRYGSCTG